MNRKRILRWVVGLAVTVIAFVRRCSFCRVYQLACGTARARVLRCDFDRLGDWRCHINGQKYKDLLWRVRWSIHVLFFWSHIREGSMRGISQQGRKGDFQKSRDGMGLGVLACA